MQDGGNMESCAYAIPKSVFIITHSVKSKETQGIPRFSVQKLCNRAPRAARLAVPAVGVCVVWFGGLQGGGVAEKGRVVRRTGT